MMYLVLLTIVFVGLQLAEGHSAGSSKQWEEIRAVSISDSLTGWDLPAPYLGSTVTSAKIMMNASQSFASSGDGARDNLVVDILGQGPIHWSISRFSRGDLSPLLQPRRPYAQSNLGVLALGGYLGTRPEEFPQQAWRPSMGYGVLLASVAQNGQQWSDGSPRFYGTVACVTDSLAYGYSMESGEFGNDRPSIHVKVGKAGQMADGNIDVAVAWFPYAQGWLGGYIDQPQKEVYAPPSWQFPGAHSPSLPETAEKLVEWGKHGATFRLPRVDPTTDGMLFTTSTDPSKENSNVNTVSIYTRHKTKEWRVQQREDSSDDSTQLVKPSQMMFAFVFVPWTAGGLIGGNVDGVSGRVKGRGPFKVNRLSVGQYDIAIAGPRAVEWGNDTKTEQDGILLLQVIGRDDVNRKYAKHVFLSYNYTESGSLLVEARHLVKGTNQEEEFPLVDCDFSFVWVDFKHPLTPATETFSGDCQMPSSSSSSFWYGFVLALAIVVVSGGIAFGGFLYIQYRSQQSSFTVFPPETDMSELGTDLLRSDYKFSE